MNILVENKNNSIKIYIMCEINCNIKLFNDKKLIKNILFFEKRKIFMYFLNNFNDNNIFGIEILQNNESNNGFIITKKNDILHMYIYGNSNDNITNKVILVEMKRKKIKNQYIYYLIQGFNL